VKNERGDSIHGEFVLFGIVSIYFLFCFGQLISPLLVLAIQVSCVSFMERLGRSKLDQPDEMSRARRLSSLPRAKTEI
jgi:hypothetical protein